MNKQQTIERISSALERAHSVREAEAFIAEEAAQNPFLSTELSDLLEKFRDEFDINLAQTHIDEGKLDDTSSVAPPRQIGPYSLGMRLGQGGFGQVYIAQQSTPIERRVAIKLIRPERSTPQIVTRFKNERQALAEMNHPNIAKIIDGGLTDDGRPYFVMELVYGSPINSFSQKRDLNILERLHMFLDVCRGVQHAHQKGVIHRDLKPSNILVGESDGENNVKIIDFGVAKIVRDDTVDDTNITLVSQMIGTPRYMSPEQASNIPEIDARSDIYSLGVILYELLTGETPLSQQQLETSSFDSVRRMICDEYPPKPSYRIAKNTSQDLGNASSQSTSRNNRLVRGDLDWIVMKALEKEPARRYQSVNELAADINRFMNDEPIIARPPSKIYRTKKFITKNRVLCGAALIVFTALAASTAFSTYYAVAATKAAAAEKTAKLNESKLRLFAETKADEAETARANEEVKRKQAENIRDVLSSILKSPGPLSGGANVTVKEMLIDSIDEIEQRFADDGETKLILLKTIGTTLYELGAYDSAITAFEGALSTSSSPSDERLWLQTQTHLADSLMAVSRFDEAMEISEDVAAASSKSYGDEDLVTLNARFNTADCLARTGRRKEALAAAKQIFAVFESHYEPQSAEYLHAELRLGEIYFRNDLYEETRDVFDRSIKKHENVFGVDDFRTQWAKNQMAEVLSIGSQSQKLEGKELIEGFLKLADTIIDADHPNLLTNKLILSRIYAAQGNHCGAIELHKEALATAEKNFGSDSTMALNMHLDLAKYYRLNGDYKQAANELEISARSPVADTHSIRLDHQRAEILLGQKKYRPAKKLLQTALKKIPEDSKLDPAVILLNRQLALSLFHLKEDKASLQLFENVLRDITEYSTEFHPKVPLVYRYIALLNERGGKVDTAIENYQNAIKVSSKLFGESDPSTVELINMMGMCYLTGRQMEKHVQTIKKAVALTEQHLPNDALAGHRARFNMAVIYRNQKKYKLATPLLKTIVESQSLMKHPAEAKHEVFEMAIGELASNYMFRRDTENAAVWFPRFLKNVKRQSADDPNRYASFLVQISTELNQYGIHAVAESALNESLMIREQLMPGNWLLDNTRSILGETKMFAAETANTKIDDETSAEIETILLESFQAMTDKKDSIPTKYRESRLTAAAERLIAFYTATQNDEQRNSWNEKLTQLQASF